MYLLDHFAKVREKSEAENKQLTKHLLFLFINLMYF